jgi:hypothetical protein
MSDQTPTVVALRPDQMEEVIRHLTHEGAVGPFMGERMLAFVEAVKAREEALWGRIVRAVAYIYGEDDPDAPGIPWAIQHIVNILQPAASEPPGDSASHPVGEEGT